MNGKIKAVITGSVMVIAIAVSSVAAQADDPGWNKDERGWWFKEADGSYPMEQWRLIGSAWNYFDSNGYMVTGWKQLNGEWYYFNSDGYMQTGWQQIDDKWYYFDGAGVMTTGELTIGGTDYYFADDGVMQDAAEQVADAAEQSADAAEQGRQEDIQLPAAADNSNPFSNNSLLFDENEAGNTESSPADSDIKKSMVTFNSDGTYSVKNLHIPENAQISTRAMQGLVNENKNALSS